MQVELRYFEDCPNWRLADARLRALASEYDFEVSHRLVSTLAEAEALRFLGSPSILVDGRDPFAVGDEPVGLSCRLFRTPDGPAGCPTTQQLRAVMFEEHNGAGVA